MLGSRLLAAALILVPLFLVIWLDDQQNGGRPGIWLGPLAVLVAALAAQELNQLLLKAGVAVSRAANVAAVVVVTSLSLAPLMWVEYPQDCLLGKTGWIVVGSVAAVAGLFLAEMRRYREPGESILRLSGGAFAVAYLGVMMACLIQLRLMLPARIGLLAVIATMLITKMADTGAFFVGKLLGRTKLTRISPGKTIEGCVGGLLFAMLTAVAVRELILPTFAADHLRGPVIAYLGFGASLMLAGLIGDLAVSLLKRDVGQKDSSSWLPGLGGVLDVIDSLLAAAPVSLMWWAAELL